MLFEGNFSGTQAISNRYSDFDFRFKINPNFGDITPLRDNFAIRASIKNIILTSPYEVPFKPEKGMGINDYVFDKNDTITQATITSEIKKHIFINEPRISDVAVRLNIQGEYLDILIAYSIFNSDETDALNISLTRIR